MQSNFRHHWIICFTWKFRWSARKITANGRDLKIRLDSWIFHEILSGYRYFFMRIRFRSEYRRTDVGFEDYKEAKCAENLYELILKQIPKGPKTLKQLRSLSSSVILIKIEFVKRCLQMLFIFISSFRSTRGFMSLYSTESKFWKEKRRYLQPDGCSICWVLCSGEVVEFIYICSKLTENFTIAMQYCNVYSCLFLLLVFGD